MGKDGGVTSGEGRSGASDVLAGFSDPTRTWFEAAFAAPTPAQVGAWETISAGRNALVVAPTGSGKTLSAFLWSLDRLASQPPPEDKLRRCKVLYVSPLKALAVDVERNLRAPLIGIRQTAERLGSPVRDITVGVRSGDTPAQERRRLATTPPDILIGFLREWDKLAVAYGYQDCPASVNEAAALDSILEDGVRRGLTFLSDQDARPVGSAHPQTHLWDNGANAVQELTRMLRVRETALPALASLPGSYTVTGVCAGRAGSTACSCARIRHSTSNTFR